ncbi:uncharacterized protein LOC121373719 [Gigantopelta aegis]|uniref:uncharacterized protein LOC121373719 n=1 Tax=Gigantopelta aegis TaxID=1735272 RepID=UPI001B889105|nr:uncharacterized protein LOC121373719 [Gigantopelta aegis]XP_041356400.1 uncharacterized protein LOC121373719 [Gigantopelta aegis]XP_041356401.1 uncharacterized protein LOC121373719 [Gigantopelta aegis]XP_041356402.1 uncharacterized protein LOC121373719 [Gigantopelta aegis]XP_041356403.1 uncharacterized protein LOC121373719 [Gigantopelta aegis]
MIVVVVVATVFVLVILLCGFRSFRNRTKRAKSYTSAGIEADVDEPPTVSRRHKRKRERRYRPTPSMEACGPVDSSFDTCDMRCDRNGRGGASDSDSSGDFSPPHKTKRKKRKRRTGAEHHDDVIAKREMAKTDEEVFLADGEESV